MTTTTVDETALNAFVLRAVDHLGAGYLGVMVSLGARLGLYRALAEAGPLTSQQLADAPTAPSATYATGRPRRPPPAMSATTLTRARSRCTPEQALVLADENSPVYLPPAWNTPRGDVERRGPGAARVPHRRGHRVGRPRPSARAWDGCVLPQRVPREPGVAVAARAGRCGGGPRARHRRRRRRRGPRGTRRFSWPRRSRTRGSTGSTRTGRRSRRRAATRERPASQERAEFEQREREGVRRTLDSG